MTKIVQRDAPILRKVAQSVSIKDIESKKIQDILNKMKKALHAEEDGAAIAAPQIGENLRIFMANGALIGLPADLVFINPEILKSSRQKKKMEEGCLSLRYLYGQVKRSKKVTLKAYDEKGRPFQRGASGLLAQIFQHEVDHLNGILFTDKAENVKDIPPTKKIKYVFFGTSKFSDYVLDELKKAGLPPILVINTAKGEIPLKELKDLDADVFVVASFGKILSQEILDLPKHGSLNVHPSLLPRLRGPVPIQGTILSDEQPGGVTIIKMDIKIDHGPILAQEKVSITPWPDYYHNVEEKLGRIGGRLLAQTLSKWLKGTIHIKPQKETDATYTKMIKKEDGLINLKDSASENLRKVMAYSSWPRAFIFFKNKNGKEVRVIIKDAEIKNDEFTPVRVIPDGKKEMKWSDFLRGN